MRRRVTRLCVLALVVWACSCGIKGRIPPWIAIRIPPATAASPLQQTANLICIELRDTYAAASTPGWKITFKACRPADYDRVVGMQHFWVWYAVVHNHRVSLNVVKIDDTGTPVMEPVVISPYQYDHLKKPTKPQRLPA